MTSWTKFTQKGYFQSKSEKMNTTSELRIFKSVYIPNFTLSWQFWFSGPNLPKKSIIYLVKIAKSERHEFCLFEISKCQTSPSRIKFASKWYFQSRTEKVNKTEHWILRIQISLGTTFQLKLTNLNFWPKFAQKGYFKSKSEQNEHTL